MSRNTGTEAAASSAPRTGPSTYSLFSADSSEDLLDGLEDFPLVPDTSIVHAITSVPYDNANDSLKNAFLEMGSPEASATPGSKGARSFAHEQQVYLDHQSMSERDSIERSRLDSDSTVTHVFAARPAAPHYEDNARVSPRVMSPSSATSSSSSTPSTPQLPHFAVGTRIPTSPPWEPSSFAPDMDTHQQGGFENGPRSSQRSSRSGPFIQHKRSNQQLSRQGTAPPSPTIAYPSMPSMPHTQPERPVGSMASASALPLQGTSGRRDVRSGPTSTSQGLYTAERCPSLDDADELYDDFDPSAPFTHAASDESYPQPPSPTMTVFSSLDDDLLPDFLDLEGDDASSRQSHTSSRPISILPGVAEVTERPMQTLRGASHTTPMPLASASRTYGQAPTSYTSGYADPVIPALPSAPTPRKAQSLSNLAGQATQRSLHNRPILQHSASSQRLYEHTRSSPLGGAEFSKPLPLAPSASYLDQDDHSSVSASTSQPSPPVSRSRRVSPLSPLSEFQSPTAHLGIPSHSPEPSTQAELRPRALSSLDMQAINNAQPRLHHSASRESGLTGTVSSRSRSSTASSWDFVPRKKPDPAIPPELAASRIPGTVSMLSPPITRQNFSPTETSRPGVHRILQQHGISGGRPEYSPTSPSFDQSISRRGSTRSASARSTASSGSSQNAIDGVQSKGSGLSDLRHKISGLLRPAQDLSPRSSEFEAPAPPGTPRRLGKASNEGALSGPSSAGFNGGPMRARALSKKSSEQLAPPHSPRANTMSRQSSTTTRNAGSTSPQPELESFIPDELTDKPLKKKLFGGLGW